MVYDFDNFTQNRSKLIWKSFRDENLTMNHAVDNFEAHEQRILLAVLHRQCYIGANTNTLFPILTEFFEFLINHFKK